MTEQDLSEIESALGVLLPDEYRRAMNASAAVASDAFWHRGLFNRAERVIRDTRWLRGYVGTSDPTWRHGRAVISEVSGGDYVLLDTADPTAPLCLWDHETGLVEVFAPSLGDFIRAVDP